MPHDTLRLGPPAYLAVIRDKTLVLESGQPPLSSRITGDVWSRSRVGLSSNLRLTGDSA